MLLGPVPPSLGIGQPGGRHSGLGDGPVARCSAGAGSVLASTFRPVAIFTLGVDFVGGDALVAGGPATGTLPELGGMATDAPGTAGGATGVAISASGGGAAALGSVATESAATAAGRVAIFIERAGSLSHPPTARQIAIAQAAGRIVPVSKLATASASPARPIASRNPTAPTDRAQSL